MTTAETQRLGEKVQTMIDQLAAISSEPGRLTRLYLSEEHKRAVRLVEAWMRLAGMETRLDAVGTMHGLQAGADGSRQGKRLLIGSHIDTVVDAGRYDGNLGVVAAIVAVEELRTRRIKLPFALEVLAFGDEEGVRFPKTLIGSSAIAGTFTADALDLIGQDGISLRDALIAFGCDPEAIGGEAMRAEDVLGYLEVHIEQGPVLEKEGDALGVVSAIASQGRYRLRGVGKAGHAGTVPMALRQDALTAAAEVVLAVDRIARAGSEHSLVATVGDLKVHPGASNVIPASAEWTLDVRAATDEARINAANAIRVRSVEIGLERGVVIDMETVHEKPVVLAAPRLKSAISAGIERVVGAAPRELMSGAGHDGQAMTHLTDLGMIFVRCRGGISHNPAEFVAVDDLGLAVEALVQTIIELAREDEPK